jgi:hypothetical protein
MLNTQSINQSINQDSRYIESNTDKSARQGNLRHPEGKISIVCWWGSSSQRTIEILPEGVGDFPVLHFFAGVWFYFSLLTLLCSCVLFDSYVLLADDHVNNVSYFPFIFNQKSSSVFLCIAWRLLCNNMADC